MITNVTYRFRVLSWAWIGALRLRLRHRRTRLRHLRELEDALEQWVNETSDIGYLFDEQGDPARRDK